MELFTQATALAAAAVLVITELLKLVPVEFTSKYPAWVNAILSVIAAFIVVAPTLTFVSVAQTLGTALLIAVVAALAYNQFTSKLKGGSSTYER
ncbi:MAG: hypothetical protein V4563_18115 [Pseudomonadota bacterium]